MGIGGSIHWYITDRCNLNCSYCFKPDFGYSASEKRSEILADALVKGGVEKVIIGGGEPGLAKNLHKILEILKKGSVYVSIHTNGTLLNKGIAEFKGLIDDIALPLDSHKRETQEKLRGKKFLPVFDNLAEMASAIKENGIKLGYHTVFTEINRNDIPQIYKLISKGNFDYWRIYEFNKRLALQPLLAGEGRGSSAERIKKIKLLESLDNVGTDERGHTDCLFAYFLLMEKSMARHKDKRTQFVGRRDVKTPYAFLDNKGDVSFYYWFSSDERRVIGNIISDGMGHIRKKLEEICEKDWEFDDKAEDEFIEATSGDAALWERLRDGSYMQEELEEVKPRFLPLLNKLSKMHTERVNSRS